ncbi:arginase family protein [Fodinicola feengrottensis]|uniref:hypothetical protein n=1 Tax=Fodinicola feengrottensis TaxID=435914 RepID=UPI0013D3CC92|nr:hypothetical protein [Fodinicola feengrottensis]
MDARDLDPAEQALLDEVEIFRCTVEELAGGGGVPDGSIYLHLDLDVSGDLPGFRIKAPGGPAFSQVVASIDRVLATGAVAAFDIAATVDPAPRRGLRRGS